MSKVENNDRNEVGDLPKLVKILPGGYAFKGLKRDTEITKKVRKQSREIEKKIIEERPASNNPIT